MPSCGSQVVLCDVPIRFDTYKGCSHACKYCFVQRKKDISDIDKGETAKALEHFINGQRGKDLRWCDWNIPLHWGGMSDPFQPAERKYKLSYECLKVFAKTQYPFIVSTKGRLVVEDEYLNLLSKCNCVVQISMVCSQYDKLEKGAPTYNERLEMCKILSKRVKRVIVRIQPYMTQVFQDVKNNMKKLADAGVYGIVIEGMKFAKKRGKLIKVGGDFVYPKEVLQKDFILLKQEAHKYGLRFFCGENRLRTLGDAMCCCGIENMEGFRGNTYNICHLINNKEAQITASMKERNSAEILGRMKQTTLGKLKYKEQTFEDGMKTEYIDNKELYNNIFGKS